MPLYKDNSNMRFPACEHLFLPLGTTLGSKRFMVAVGLLFLSLLAWGTVPFHSAFTVPLQGLIFEIRSQDS